MSNSSGEAYPRVERGDERRGSAEADQTASSTPPAPPSRPADPLGPPAAVLTLDQDLHDDAPPGCYRPRCSGEDCGSAPTHSMMIPVSPPLIRPYRPEDDAALYDVCVRTAHQGGDARHIYPDLDLMPNIYAGPYVYLEPDLAFVLDNGERAVGYILGTADT